MSRAPWPAAFGRGRSAPLQIDVPQRLPGGIWGPTPIGGTVSWDAQGVPVGPSSINLTAISNANQLRAEWPIPVRWELQFWLSLQCLTTDIPWNGQVGSLVMIGAIETSVESATIVQEVQLSFGPGVYPLTAAFNGVAGLGSTFPVIGQTVITRINRLELGNDQNLAGTTWAWKVNTVAGLTASGWPA
jgi:hypothetical protein